MEDKRKTNGGKREGAGRKSKAEEYGLHEEMDELKPNQRKLRILKWTLIRTSQIG